MKSTIVIYGSSTGSCQSVAETIASKLGVEAVDVTTRPRSASTLGLRLSSHHFNRKGIKEKLKEVIRKLRDNCFWGTIIS